MGNVKTTQVGGCYPRNGQIKAPDDIPVINYKVIRTMQVEVEAFLKKGVWLNNYKRAFRAIIRHEKPERSQYHTFQLLHRKAANIGDGAGDPTQCLELSVLDPLTDKYFDQVKEDFIDQLVDLGKLTTSASETQKVKEARAALKEALKWMCLQLAETSGKYLYDCYGRDDPFDLSDEETAMAAAKEKAMKAYETERQRAASVASNQGSDDFSLSGSL